MDPDRPTGQASLEDLIFTKRKHTKDEGLAREVILRFRPEMQHAVATGQGQGP